MKRIFTLCILVLLVSLKSWGQTTLISASDGGFETGTTFAANGWTSVNDQNNNWYVGAATFSTGSRAAYIDKNSSAGSGNSYNATNSETSHFYRDITIPAGGTNIQLSFQLKGSGETGYDRLLVYTAPTTVTPVGFYPISPSTSFTGATLVYTQTAFFSSYTTQSITLPNSLAGTTVRLIFTWQNDGSGSTQPPAALDNISLTCTSATVCTTPSAPTGVALGTSTTTSQAGTITAPGTVPTGYLVVASTSTTLSSGPVNGTTYTVGNSLGGGIVEYVNTSTSFTASTSLNPNTKYNYFVYSYNSGCSGAPYYSTTSVSNNKYTCIAAPTALAAGSITGNSASISWTNASGSITSYNLLYSTTSGGPYTTISSVTNPYTLSGLSAGTTYYYEIVANNTANTSSCGPSATSSQSSFKTHIANDDCTGAIALSCGGNYTGDNTSASDETLPASSCTTGANYKGVWFTYTAATTSTVTISTVGGATWDTYLRAYSGACGSLSCIAYNDDYISGSISQSSVTFNVTAGSTYYILLTGYNATNYGSYTITATCPPVNDNCSSAIALSCGGSYTGNNAAAADETLPSSTCGSTSIGYYKGVWFTYTASTSGSVTVSTCSGTSWDSYLRAYQGTCSSLSCVSNTNGIGYDDDGCGTSAGPSTITFNAVLGTTYYFLLAGYSSSDGGAYNISLACVGTCSTPPVPTALSLTTSTTTSQQGTITASSPVPTGYIVVASTSSTLSAGPVNGQSYVAGNTIGGGTVEYSGTSGSFTASTSLNSNTKYYYFVYSYNSGCSGAPYYSTTATSNNKYTCIAAPTGLTTVSTAQTSANLSWTAPNGSITSYTINYGTTSGGPYLNTASSATNSVTLSGLTAGTTYYYIVIANNTSNNSSCGTAGTSSSQGTFTTLLATCTAPNAPTNLTLTPQVGGTSVTGTFSAPSPSPTGYLVIRTTTSTAPSTPSNGITYTAGTSALGGYIVSTNTTTGFTDNGLTPSTQYWYWVYSYNSTTCSGGPLYSITNLNGTTTTLTCSANTLYWAGAGSSVSGHTSGLELTTASNWSTSSGSYSASSYSPNSCTNAVMNLSGNGTYTLTQSAPIDISSFAITLSSTSSNLLYVTLNISKNLSVANALTITNSSTGSDDHEIDFNVTGGTTTCGSVTTTASGSGGAFFGPFLYVSVSSGAVFYCTNAWNSSCTSGSYTVTDIDNNGTLTITGNSTFTSAGYGEMYLNIGNSPAVTTLTGSTSIGSNSETDDIFGDALNTTYLGAIFSNSTGKFVFKGNLTLGPSSATATSSSFYGYPLYPNVGFVFDATSSQTITDNTGEFYHIPGNFIVGSSNSPTVTIVKGATPYTPDDMCDVYTNLSINGTSTLIIPANEILNNYSGTGTLSVANGATLKVGGTSSISPATSIYTTNIGSNFPYNYSVRTLNTTSTVEYNGTSNQTIYAVPTYANLTLTNNSTKTAGGTLTVITDLTNNSASTFDVSANNYAVSVGRNWTNNGALFNARNGTITFNTNVNGTVSGSSPTAFNIFAMDKGSSTATTLDVNGTGAITITKNNSTTTITNGLLRINSGASFTKNPTTSGGIAINSTAGISNNGGIFNLATNGSVTNNGLFQTLSGTSTIGNASGNSVTTSGISTGVFDMQGGTLNVAGIIENTAGTFTMSGGIATVCTIGNALSNKGSFNMSLSTTMTMTGGSVIFQNPSITAGVKQDLNILNSGTKNITGGTFQFGNGSTGGGSLFQCSSEVPVYNVTINNVNNPNTMLTKDLTVNGVLTLNSFSTTGALLLNDHTLTLNSVLSGTGTLSGSASSGLVVNGAAGTAYFTRGNPSNQLKTLTVNGSLTLGGNVTTGDTLNIVAGAEYDPGTVTVTGTLNTGKLLTLKSDANATARVAQSTGIISDTVEVERYIPAIRAWRFLCTPFKSSNQTIHNSWQEGVNNYDLDYANNKNPHPEYGMHVTYNNIPANGFDVNTTTNPSMLFWDYTINDWSYSFPPTTTTNITDSGGAFIAFVRGSRSVDLSMGVSSPLSNTVLRARGILNTGPVTKSISTIVPKDNFVFVPNPYPSSIVLTNVLTRSTGIYSNKFYIYDPGTTISNGSGYTIAYDNGLVVPHTANYPKDTTLIIESGQAFTFVASSTTAPVIKFDESDKVIPSASNVFGNAVKQPSPRIYINLMRPQDDSIVLIDGVGAIFAKRFSPLVDYEDAGKIDNPNNEDIALERNGYKLAIEARPVPKQKDTLFLQLYYMSQASYALQITPDYVPDSVHGEGWLIDKYLNTQTQLHPQDTTVYNFTANSDTLSYLHRFIIVFSPGKGKIVAEDSNTPKAESIKLKAEASTVSVYPNPVSKQNVKLRFSNMPVGNYDINVISAAGVNLARRTVTHKGGDEEYPLSINDNWANGVYTIKVINKESGEIENISLVISK